MDKKITQNYFLLPAIISFLQLVLIFFSLFNRENTFSARIIIFNFLIFIFWFSCFVYKGIKFKTLRISKYNIFFLIVSVLVSCYLITRIWGKHYLQLTSITNFFNGRTFIDTLYHSSIIGSIKTNGYPSILQNGTDLLYYHCLAHYFVAALAFLFHVPAFIALNYIYPIVFLPIFSWLVLKVASISKHTFSNTYDLSILDYSFIIAIFLGFMTEKFLGKIGFFLYSSVYLSESSFISLILVMLYFCLIDRINKIQKFELINQFFLIPVFIFILSFAKISAGAIFCAGVCYYYFRNFFYKDKRWILCIFYAFLFLSYYKMRSKSNSFTNPEPELAQSSIVLFHYVRTYTKNVFYAVLHYIFMFFPGIVIFICNKIDTHKKNIFLEIVLFISFISCIPGIILKIDGGSAFDFCTPAFLFSCIILLGYGFDFTWLYEKIEVILILMQKNIQFVFSVIFLLFVSMTMFKESNFINIARSVVHNRYEGKFFSEFPNSFLALFKASPFVVDKTYNLFNEIYDEIKDEPQRYCIFIEDDYSLYKKYRDYENAYYGGNIQRYNFIKPNMCVTAWFGIPVINSMYIDDNIFYRGDGEQFGRYNDFAGYSIPPRTCGAMVTNDNAIDVAKKMNKDYIIFIKKDIYDIKLVN